MYTVHLWDDLNAYYRDVYHQVQTIKGGRPIELFPPAFVASAFLGIGGYFADGTVSRTFLQGTMDETGADRVRSAIEFYTNGTQAGSVLYTNYFWPGRSNAAQVAFDYFPQWLKDHITNDGYVSRITEWGWFPDSFQPPQVGCLADLDTTDHPCDSPQPEIHSWSDYNDWARHRTQSGGAAMWILSTTAGGLFEQQAAVTAGGVIRDWFKRFCAFADANL